MKNKLSITRAMILAAGEGRRMRPLTDNTPKPLLEIAGKALIEYHLERIAACEISETLVNTAYLGEKIQQALGSGEKYGTRIRYSEESEPLETAGGIVKALPFFQGDAFLLVNGDVWLDISTDSLNEFLQRAAHSLAMEKNVAHLMLVANPSHNPRGDFSLQDGRVTSVAAQQQYTFAGVSVWAPEVFSTFPDTRTKFALKEILDFAIVRQQISGEFFAGKWIDVGTPERLEQLESYLKNKPLITS